MKAHREKPMSTKNSSPDNVEIAFRIPGNWAGAQEFVARLPKGIRLEEESIILEDGTELGFFPMDSDDQFAEIFASSCRRSPSREEMSVVRNYTVNIGLSGPGGSKEAAHKMMEAAAIILNAGGAGVFIDNSGLAHGKQDWLDMTEDGGTDAISFAYLSVIQGKDEVWTMGFHALGLPDLSMRRADADQDENALIELINYMAAGDKPVGDGHLFADELGPRYRASSVTSDRFQPGSPMYNPFGILKLISMREIQSGN